MENETNQENKDDPSQLAYFKAFRAYKEAEINLEQARETLENIEAWYKRNLINKLKSQFP